MGTEGHALIWHLTGHGWSARKIAAEVNLSRSQVHRIRADVKLRLKLAGEIRLQDAQLTRLLKLVKTEPPAEPSLRSVKAQRAARVRWDRDASA
jgi:hypothetical protein